MTAEEIYEYILKTVYSGLEMIRDGRIFIIAACIILSITASLDVMRKNEGKAYLSSLTAGKKYHYALIAGTAALSLWSVKTVFGYTVLCSVLSASALAASLGGAFFLLKWNRMGIPLTYGSLLFSAGAMDAWRTAVSAADIPNIKSYNPGGMYSLLVAADYHSFRAQLLWTAVCGIIVYSSGYYMRRRYLFSGVSGEFARCPHCGKPAAKGEKYCICCGTQLMQETEYEPPYTVIDEGKYCPKCGTKLREGKCPKCDDAPAAKQIRDAFLDKGMGTFRGLLSAVIILVLALSPVLFSKTWDLSKGSAALNNAYVQNLQEFAGNRKLAQDDAWYEGCRRTYTDLYVKDCAWMKVAPQSVTHSDLVYFVLYSEASFRQIEAMEKIDRTVTLARLGETVTAEEIGELTAAFDSSVEEQNEAALTARRYQMSGGILTKALNALTDGLRFWTQWAPMRYIAVLMMVAGLSAALSFLGSFYRETGIRTPFSRENLRQADVWLAGVLSKKGTKETPEEHDEFRKNGRLAVLYGTALACLIMILSWSAARYLPADSSEAAEDEYRHLCGNVLTERFDETSVWISRLSSTSYTFTKEETAQIVACFSDQAEADGAYLAFADVEEEYAAFDERMDAFCTEEKEIIAGLLDALEKGMKPDRDLLVRYAILRADRYQDVMKEYLRQLIEDAGNSIADLAG